MFSHIKLFKIRWILIIIITYHIHYICYNIFEVSMKLINKWSIIRIEKSFVWAKPRAGPETPFPDYSQKLLQRSWIIHTVLYLMRTKNIKPVRASWLRGFRKQNKTFQHVDSKSACPWPMQSESCHQRRTNIGIIGRGI